MPASDPRARAARRRARRIASARQDLHEGHWAALTAAWGGCAYCRSTRGPLQRDCVQPVARGGRYTFGNVVPACRPCNASKCDSEVTGWLRRKRLDERAFLLRHARITAELSALFAAPPAAAG